MQTSNADRRCSCPMWRCCQKNSCRYEGSGRSELTKKLPFRPHPEVFHILRVDVRVDWVNKMLLVNYNVVEIHTSVQLTNVVICPPAVGHDVCARKAPLSCRCRSIAYHGHTTQPTLPLDDREHPHTVHKPSTVVLSVEKVRFVDFDNNWVSIVVETTKLNGIPPDVCGAYIPDEVRPVDGRLPRNRQVPLHVVHGDFRCPTKQEPHKLPQSNLALEEGVYSEAFSPMTLSVFPAVAVLRISLCHQATRNRTLRACVPGRFLKYKVGGGNAPQPFHLPPPPSQTNLPPQCVPQFSLTSPLY